MSSLISFRWATARSARPDVRLVLVQEGQVLASPSLSASERKKLDAWIKGAKFEGAVATTAWPSGWADPILLIGIGKRSEFHVARWLRAWAVAGRVLRQMPMLKRVSFEWPAKVSFPIEQAALMGLAAEGMLSGAYTFDVFKTKKKSHRFIVEWAGSTAAEKPVRASVRRAETLGTTLHEIRDLANLPANELSPMQLALRARKLAKASGLSCRVWDQTALEKEKCGALLAVAKGSRKPGCLIRLAHKGRPGLKPLVVVGKAVTFDSGGISLKPGKNMEWMKYDKSGGMTALAVVLVAARL